jgi:tetratricopeptide (TPR) repeat protein
LTASFDEIYKKTEFLLRQGKSKEAENHLIKLERLSDLSLEDQMKCKTIRVLNSFWQKKFEISKKLADEAIEICEKNDLFYYQILASLYRVRVSIQQRFYDDCILHMKKIKKLLPKLEKIDKTDYKELKALYYYTNGYYLVSITEYEKALEQFELSLAINKELKDKFRIGQVLLHTAGVLRYLHELDSAINFYDTSLEIFKDLDYRKYIAQAYHGKAGVFYHRGELNSALEYANRGLVIREELGDDFEITQSMEGIGYIYSHQGNYDRALEIHKNRKLTYEKLGMKHEAAKCLLDIHNILMKKGEYDHALGTIINYSNIKNELNDQIGIGLAQKQMGMVYAAKGEFDEALLYYETSLEILQKVNYLEGLHDVYFNLGVVHYIKGNNEEAIRNHVLALEMREKRRGGRSQPVLIAESLRNLIEIHLEIELEKKAKQYFEYLEQLSKEAEIIAIKHMHSLTKALLAKNKSSEEDKNLACLLLEQLIEDTKVNHEILTDALLNLANILFWKLGNSQDETIIVDLEKIIQKLEKSASTSNSYSLLAESYFLKSQLSILQLNLEEAKELISKAQYIAKEKGLVKLAIKISNEYDKLLEKMDRWEEFTERLPSIADKLELTHLEDQLNMVIKGSMASDAQLEVEFPVLFTSISETGSILFSENFDEKLSIDDLKEIMTDINKKIREESVIKRHRIKDYSYIIERINSLNFCYVFVGRAYISENKMQNFTDLLYTESSLLEDLKTISHLGGSLEVQVRMKITRIIDDIFLSSQET